MTTPTGPGITAPQAPTQVGAVRTQSPVGQNLTPNPNVFAIMQMGGDTWGANGGGAVAIGGGATDQTGYNKSIAASVCGCEVATNFIPTPPFTQQYNSTLARESVGTLTGDNFPTQLGSVGNNAG